MVKYSTTLFWEAIEVEACGVCWQQLVRGRMSWFRVLVSGYSWSASRQGRGRVALLNTGRARPTFPRISA